MIWQTYRTMYTIRRTEEMLLDLYSRGLLFGTVHTSVGQEAADAGVVSVLDREKDVIWSNHRGHGHYLAYSDDVEGLIAEVMGRSTGVCRGIGGSQHLHARNFYTNGVLGGTVACAAGAAFAEKERGEGGIAAVFFGDGALGQGVVFESMNLAALWDLPLLFVLESNGIAQTTPTPLAHAGNLSTRADTFGIAGSRLNGLDVEAVREAAVEAAGYVRRRCKPFFLFLDVLRLAPHSKGDDTRAEDEIEALRVQDPVPSVHSRLLLEDEARLRRLEADVSARIATAVESAKNAPYAETLFA